MALSKLVLYPNPEARWQGKTLTICPIPILCCFFSTGFAEFHNHKTLETVLANCNLDLKHIYIYTLFPRALHPMEVWPREMMFSVQYFDNYKCCWDSEPNTTAVITDPEKLFSGSCQQMVINFFVVVQAGFWACSPLALWAACAVTGTLHRTHPSSFLHHCLQNAVCKALRAFLLSVFTSKLENASLLTALRRHLGPAKMRCLL